MISINLLPWRESARNKALKKFYAQLVGIFIFSALIIGLLSAQLSKQNDTVQARLNTLQDQSAEQAPLLKKTTILLNTKIKLINRLKQSIKSQEQYQRLLINLNDLSKQIRPGITIKKIHVQNNLIVIECKATSQTALAQMTAMLKNESDITLADISGLNFTIEKTSHDPSQ